MNQAPAAMHGKAVRLPEGNVLIKMMPAQEMIHYSKLLPQYNYDDMCYLISVPATSTMGHLTKFLGLKFNQICEDANLMWSEPFLIFVNIKDNKYSPVPRPTSLEQLKLVHIESYNSTEKCFNLYYSHDYPLPDLTVITAQSPVAVLDPSSGPLSGSSTDSAMSF